MRVVAAFLADAARVEGGKLYVHGGGWTAIQAPHLPVVHPTLALVLVLEIGPTDQSADRVIPLSIDLLEEAGAQVTATIEGEIQRLGRRGASVKTADLVSQAITFNLLEFRKAGGYRFRIRSGGEEVASVAFQVVEGVAATTEEDAGPRAGYI